VGAESDVNGFEINDLGPNREKLSLQVLYPSVNHAYPARDGERPHHRGLGRYGFETAQFQRAFHSAGVGVIAAVFRLRPRAASQREIK
jgi:hypothetical protein